MQMHKDIGERLAMKRKLRMSEWTNKRNKYHPGKSTKDAKGVKAHFQAWGDPCPPNYRIPPYWDILGIVSPRKKAEEALPEIKCDFTPVNVKQAQPASRKKPDHRPYPAELYTPTRGLVKEESLFGLPTALGPSQELEFLPDVYRS